METTKLVHMVNQIALAFRLQPKDEAVSQTVEHLRAFWSPQMRQELLAYVASGGAGLEPLAKEAAAKLSA
ncbi:MAG: formate dehydrogenase subunit delta [Archangiaceae bacterium]|nr:formate dehydrogenase subunit delta [Archangiaceae bacterium]